MHAEISSRDTSPVSVDRETDCPKCGASFSFESFRFSSRCPYCETPAIVDCANPLTPDSVLPFRIDRKEAHENFAKWIGSLWFAPSELKHVVDTQKELTGFYLPHWFFDTDTFSDYSGERGDAYYVTVERSRIINGRETIVQEQERRIRWTPVSGSVSRNFRDIIIVADTLLPVYLLKSIGSWNPQEMKSFKEEYLSCFESQEYTIAPADGYAEAESIMRSVIRRDVRRDIGGDEQRIYDIRSSFFNQSYSYTLLPVWSTHFKYKGKIYHYVINGQNGMVAGNRPYSYVKIFLLVIAILLLLSAIYYWQDIAAVFGAPAQPAAGTVVDTDIFIGR